MCFILFQKKSIRIKFDTKTGIPTFYSKRSIDATLHGQNIITYYYTCTHNVHTKAFPMGKKPKQGIFMIKYLIIFVYTKENTNKLFYVILDYPVFTLATELLCIFYLGHFRVTPFSYSIWLYQQLVYHPANGKCFK